MNDALKDKPVMLVAVLGAVCILAAVALGLIYAATKPRIEAEELKAKEQALRDVHPAAVRFEEIKSEYEADGKPLSYYEAYDAAGTLVGYAFEGQAAGYSSTIELTVGLSADEKTITGIKITKQQDTPGLGANCVKGGATRYVWEIFSRAEAAGDGQSFQGQFTSMTLEQLGREGIPPNIRALSGATITTNAVLRATRQAITNYYTARGRGGGPDVTGATRKENSRQPGGQGP